MCLTVTKVLKGTRVRFAAPLFGLPLGSLMVILLQHGLHPCLPCTSRIKGGKEKAVVGIGRPVSAGMVINPLIKKHRKTALASEILMGAAPQGLGRSDLRAKVVGPNVLLPVALRDVHANRFYSFKFRM